MLFVLVVPLDAFNSKKRQAENERQDEQDDYQAAFSQLCGADAEGDGQAAADQNNRVGRAQVDVEAAAAGGKFVVVPDAINQVGAEHAAEEHDFRAKEQPHAEGGGVALLLDGREVMTEFRTVLVLLDRDRAIAQATPPEAREAGRSCRLPRSPPALPRN